MYIVDFFLYPLFQRRKAIKIPSKLKERERDLSLALAIRPEKVDLIIKNDDDDDVDDDDDDDDDDVPKFQISLLKLPFHCFFFLLLHPKSNLLL